MNAKTYGQVLFDVMDETNEFHCMGLVDAEIFEQVARAVILEAFRRVEERAEAKENGETVKPFYKHSEDYLADAFYLLAAELKEAK